MPKYILYAKGIYTSQSDSCAGGLMQEEKLGIQHIGSRLRHGRPFMTFTLWLAANLTIADYALGSIFYGLPLTYIILAIVIGNVLGGLLLGLMASMGPSFGLPQMMASRAYFGRKGNTPFAVANWISTVGWFTVNIVLGGYAVQLLLNVPFIFGAAMLVVVQGALAIYGHDAIHRFELFMAVALAVMFALVGIAAYSGALLRIPSYQASASFNPYLFALCVAAVFSYLMSWSPYASDYSRYLPEGTSRAKVAAYAMLAGLIACTAVELIGVWVYVSVGGAAANPIVALAQAAGSWSALALLAIILGSVTANSLNLYTNSLSAQIVYGKVGRARAVLAASAIGLALAVAGSSNFALFYQDFLLTLDYWITPWIAVMVGGFFISRAMPKPGTWAGVRWRALLAYLAGLLVSVPFMNLTSYGIPYEGVFAAMWGGADVSYFVSFIAALFIYAVFASGRASPQPAESASAVLGGALGGD